MRLVQLFTLLFLSFSGVAQHQSGIGISIGLNRLDYQIGIVYSETFRNRWQVDMTTELAISRSLVQQRLSPRNSMRTSYLAVSRGKVRFGPSVAYGYSWLRLTGSSYHRWHELFVGYLFEYGEQWSVFHSASAGWLHERLVSQLTNQLEGFSSYGYHANIGVKYRF